MSDVFSTLQKRYQALIARWDEGETGESFLEDARSFIGDARRAGAAVPDLNERSQLRAWMRFLANALYAATGVHPDVSLQPLARGKLVAPQRKEKASLPPVGWALMGGAAVVIIAALLWLARWPPSQATPTPAPTSGPPIPVGNVEVGFGQSSAGDLVLPAEVFCANTTLVVARFTIPEPLPADARWSWTLAHTGRSVAAGPSLAWETGSTGSTTSVALPNRDPFTPGEYELTFLIDDLPVANRIFEVLAEEPRATNLWISNVPTRTGHTEFEPDTRIIYAAYDYENLCPGAAIARAIYLDGEVVHESQEAWTGTSDGSGVIEFYEPDGLPRGEYRVVLSVGNQEPQQATFAIADATPPAFGEITVALGVQPDGEPIFPAQEDSPFGSNTKLIYAIFDYTRMSDGLEWEVMWLRNGEEAHRRGALWSAEGAATEDTHWVVYYKENGDPLGGGDYTVTLYIDDELQETADFRIYYPAE